MTDIDKSTALVDYLREMVICCKAIQELLKADKTHFNENRLDLVDDSNQKKTALLDQLNDLTIDVTNMVRPVGLIEKIKQSAHLSASTMQAEAQSLVQELKTEIASSYKYISANSGIVANNLNYIKDVWDKIIAYNSADHCIYDSKGGIK